MRVLLDTNILINREARTIVRDDIGGLFHWLDRLKCHKCIHSHSLSEIAKHADPSVVRTFRAKLGSYDELKTIAPDVPDLAPIRAKDLSENDEIDTTLVNELAAGRVDLLISEDRGVHRKAQLLGLNGSVFTIDSFLEKVTAEHPNLTDYAAVSVRKEFFGNIDVNDAFFDSFRQDYPDFNKWFARKSDEIAYVCRTDAAITAFLYLKVESEIEPYPDIEPVFRAKKRLKIGTFKVALNGVKLGERFLKIIFDNAVRQRVSEVYVTAFEHQSEQRRLITLLEQFGFRRHGTKQSSGPAEAVFTRNMTAAFDTTDPRLTYPYFRLDGRTFIVSIYPDYHTSLFPDSILQTESPMDFEEHEPHRNAIRKVFVSRSYEKDIRPGDNLLFYRTGGYYKGVVSTVGVVEAIHTGIETFEEFRTLCGKRSVFSEADLRNQWNYKVTRPFVVDFLYNYSLPKRPNLKRLIEMGVIKDIQSAPRGFDMLKSGQFKAILEESKYDDSITVD